MDRFQPLHRDREGLCRGTPARAPQRIVNNVHPLPDQIKPTLPWRSSRSASRVKTLYTAARISACPRPSVIIASNSLRFFRQCRSAITGKLDPLILGRIVRSRKIDAARRLITAYCVRDRRRRVGSTHGEP